MDFASYDVLRSKYKAAVEDAFPVPTVHDNGPALGETNSPYPVPDPSADLWARAAVLTGESLPVENAGGGTVTSRTPGVLKVTTYGPAEGGDVDQLKLVDFVADAFRGLQVGPFSFGVPDATVVGKQGPWHTIDVDCPFEADLQK